ncbi:MAG: hypothetical protein ACREAK_06135 [Nitrosarchaeum sp.]
MKRMHIGIICSIAVVFTLAMSLANTEIKEPTLISNTVPNEILSVNVMYVKVPDNLSEPEPITLGEHGQSMSTESIKSKTTFEVAEFKDTSNIKMEGKSIHLIDTRLGSDNTVYYYYGADSTINDSTRLRDFMSKGGIVVTTAVMERPDAVYAALANFDGIKGKVSSVNGVVSHGDEFNGYAPSEVFLYPGDGRVISVWTDASLPDTIKIAEKLGLENRGLDLSKYVDKNWTE